MPRFRPVSASNSGTSPICTFGYAPMIYDLQAIDPLTGRPIKMFMNGGGSGTSNPFDVLENITANEVTWRQTGNVRANYALLSGVKNNVQLSYIGGVDRYQQEGIQYSPNFLQFESNDGFSRHVADPEQMYLDQLPMPSPFNLAILPSPKNIAGIEVYAGSATIPPQFNGFNGGCGVILVWTREGY